MTYIQKYVFQVKARNINVKTFNVTTNKNEAKTMIKHISCDRECKSVGEHVIQIKNGIIIHANRSVKSIVSPKKKIVGILAHVFVKMASI